MRPGRKWCVRDAGRTCNEITGIYGGVLCLLASWPSCEIDGGYVVLRVPPFVTIVTSLAKEVMFLVALVSLSVCLFVCGLTLLKKL